MNFLDRADAVAKRIERFVSGSAHQDPLYVSNRTIGQKVRAGLLIGAPLVVIAVFIALAMNNYFTPESGPERTAAAKPAGEVTGKILPKLDKDLAISSEYSRDIEVLEASVSRTGERTLSGKVRNTTDHTVEAAEMVFDVTDSEGSQLGGVSVRLENIAARAIVPFKITLAQQDARSALVREVHSR